ncbi:MAG TPA: TIGR03067 domain-containing protein [Gemmataceae bacterium]|nr:TIGR03067 domain-containing protein [Gemmataceae bacterium]
MFFRKGTMSALALWTVCSFHSDGQGQPKEKAMPKVTGQWTGTWGPLLPKPASPNAKSSEALMDCAVVYKDGTWQATFEGECGRPYKYTVKMEGRQAGDVVLFKGTTDLGEKDGGVFDWIGRAGPQEFIGFYTSAKYTGTFRLTPKKEDLPNKVGQKELDAFQGKWVTASLIYNGKDFLANGKRGFHFVFNGAEASIEGDEAVKKEYAKFKVKLDTATTPKCLDITVTGGIQLNATIEGIYELKDDELKICAKVFGNERPTEFASGDGSSIALLILKREP